MNSSNRSQGAGFRSGPIRNVGGGPPSLNNGLAVNNNNIRPSSASSTSSRSSSSAVRQVSTTPIPVAPPPVSRHPYDARPVHQNNYAPYSQQNNSETLNMSYNTNLGPDNSAQLQPHNVASLPPQPQQSNTTTAAPAFHHPLDSTSTNMNSNHSDPAAELQRRFYPKHYNNTQQQQVAASPPKSSNQYIATSSSHQHQLSNPPAYNQVRKTPPRTTQQQHYQQQQQQQPRYSPVQRTKQPQLPEEEDVDNFLSTGLTDSASGMTYTRPKPLSLTATDGVLSKSKLLASRRAWGDVIRVTNDALIVRNMDGGGGSDVGRHHSFYSEIVACATNNAEDSTNEGGGVAPAAQQASSPNEMEEIQKLRRETCELIVLRFIAHLKLRRYVDLGKEVAMLGLMPFLPDKLVDGSGGGDDNELNNYMPLAWKEGSLQSIEVKDTVPSWIPYGLRILAAQQLQYNDGSSKALDVLLDMRDRSIRTEYWNTSGMEIWKSSIDNAIVNVCIRMKEWRMALYYLEEMINGLEEGVEREVLWQCRQEGVGGSVGEGTRSQLRELITSAAYVELLSRQILILLQSGAVKAAETLQSVVQRSASKVEEIVLSGGSLSRIHKEFDLVRQAPVRVMMNDGLILFAQSDYELAATRFRDAMELQQSIAVDEDDASSPQGYSLSWKDLDSPTLGFGAEPSLTVECINNLSLCLLYSGKMRTAVQEMESLIRQDPCENLTEGLAFNLCTLYELGSDGEECTKRKKRLQRVAKRFFLHDIGAESFRLN